MVEVATSVLFFASSWRFTKEPFFLNIASFFFVSFLVLFVFSDFKWRLLPHLFNNLFVFAGLIFIAVHFPDLSSDIFMAVSGFIIMGSVMFGLIQFFPNGLGGGDIKMIAGLAVWMGLFKAACVLVFACAIASFLFLILLAAKRVAWNWMIPFGPFLALGALGFWFLPDLFNQVKIIFIRMN